MLLQRESQERGNGNKMEEKSTGRQRRNVQVAEKRNEMDKKRKRRSFKGSRLTEMCWRGNRNTKRKERLPDPADQFLSLHV